MFPLHPELLWAVRQTWHAGQGKSYQPADVLVFWFVESGTLLNTINGLDYVVNAGHAFLQYPGVSRTLFAQDNVRWASIGIHYKAAGQTRLEPVLWSPQPSEAATIQVAFDQILSCRNANDLAGRWRREGALRLLMGMCLEQVTQPVWPQWLQAAVTQIEAQPFCELAAVAASAGYSPTQFRVLFREHMGMAPAEYATQCLATRARELVAETEWPVSRISRELNFAASSHFCRFFKRRFGISPLEFRREVPGSLHKTVD